MTKKLLISLTILALLAGQAAAQRQKPVSTRIMTFNIRYENKGDSCNNWELRYQKVAKFIQKSKAGIIGLQEVTPIQLEDLSTLLKDYDKVGVARDDGQQKGEYNPIFYNKNKFNLLRSGTFWLSENPNEPSHGWDAACRRIATWAFLQDKMTMKSIMVLNTHLDHVGKEARLNSAGLIKERLARMVNDIPVVMTGDFNVDDTDPVYNKIRTNLFPLNDAWKTASAIKGAQYTFHDFGRLATDKRTKIDYILVSPKIKVKRATVFDSSLGKGFFLSDHNAHSADIVF